LITELTDCYYQKKARETVSNNEQSNNFFTEFLEDYFAESEEHLIIVRNQLLALEPFVDQPKIDPNILNTLFRSFHTLKGLSGMVGVKEAEELAHKMESYLRILRDDKVVLSSPGFDGLINGTKLLEEVINSYRNKGQIPKIEPILNQIETVIPQANPKLETENNPILTLKEDTKNQIKFAKDKGEKVWHFVFSSSPELAAKGINVTVIRSRLENLGQLIHVAPRMTPKGQICFDFVVATQVEQKEFFPWISDGLSWSPYKTDKETPKETETTAEIEITIKPQIESTLSEDTPASLTSTTPTNQPTTVVRVDLGKLDDLMRMVGDLVISRARLQDNLKHLAGSLKDSERRSLQEINLTLERQLRDLREGVMRVRLVPIGEVFARMQFVVRDLVRESRKQVALEITGQETEIDKFVVERMLDPLLHLVRNAVSHGIETTETRQQKGKTPEGHIYLRAKTSGEMVIIEIEDDGKGVDLAKVIATGKAKGFLHGDDKETNYDSLTILDLLCSPGFSTKEKADLTSGRGVGMAIVKNTVTELGGIIDLKTTKDQGTRFTIQLPLTLAIADALIISLADQTFAIPQSAVREVTEINRKDITRFEHNEIVGHRGQVLPLIRLKKLFNFTEPNIHSPPSSEENLTLVIAGSQINAIGLIVDRIIGMREIVIRALIDPLVQAIGIAGATELGDGRVVLILDISALMRSSVTSYQ
jgi:two-component system chemotaxis sensor kinase CheA